jgi:hypothetical protein
MHAAGLLEKRLGLAQARGQVTDDFRIDAPVDRGQRGEGTQLEGLHGGLAAYAAAGGGVEIPLQAAHVDRDAGPQRDPHAVLPAALAVTRAARVHGLDLVERTQQPLPDEKTSGQFAIVAGRPHGDRDGLPFARCDRAMSDLNFQRLLQRDVIQRRFGMRTGHFLALPGEDLLGTHGNGRGQRDAS